MQAVHQFIAGFVNGDAISNETIVINKTFASLGHETNIFCETRRTLPHLRSLIKDIKTAKAIVKPSDVAILHLSIGSDVNDVFAELTCRKAIIFHNITPPCYFKFFNPAVALLLQRGLEQVQQMKSCAEVYLADSKYNADELLRLGYKDVRVLPLLINYDMLKNVDKAYFKKLCDGFCNILFVGRIAPNKKIEDVIFAFHCFKKWVNPDSRLILAGSYSGMERYLHFLKAGMKELGTEDVIFTGMIPQEKLNACYAAASIFLCMSEHEGFCIPLLESMYHSVPVMAYSAAAVPETMDGAGILFREKQFDKIAEMMGVVWENKTWREAIIRGQRERLSRYKERNLAGELCSHLERLFVK